MLKKLCSYGVIFVLSIGFAYYASLPKEAADNEAVDWVNFGEKEIKSITLDAEDVKASVTPYAGGFWVVHEKSKPVKPEDPKAGDKAKSADKAKADDKAKAGDKAAANTPAKADDKGKTDDKTPAAPAAVTWVKKEFKANDRMNDVLTFLAPMKAIRVVGDSKSLNLDDFGFAKDKPQTFTVTANDGKTLKLVIGKKSFGTSNWFALDEAKGKVILIKGNNIENLAKADLRMVERGVTSIKSEDIKKARLSVGGKESNWDHSTMNELGEPQWKAEGQTAAHKGFDNWMNKIWRLRLAEYATAEEAKVLETSPAVFELSVFDNSKEIEKFTIKKQINPIDNKTVYWIKTNFLGAFGKLNMDQAEGLEKDLSDVIAAGTK